MMDVQSAAQCVLLHLPRYYWDATSLSSLPKTPILKLAPAILFLLCIHCQWLSMICVCPVAQRKLMSCICQVNEIPPGLLFVLQTFPMRVFCLAWLCHWLQEWVKIDVFITDNHMPNSPPLLFGTMPAKSASKLLPCSITSE